MFFLSLFFNQKPTALNKRFFYSDLFRSFEWLKIMIMAYSVEEINSKFDLIISKIEDGQSLRKSLKDEGIGSEVFYKWISAKKDNSNDLTDDALDKSKRYAHACEERAEKIFDEIFDIADDGSNDFMKIVKGDMEYEVENKEVISRSRLRVDARKWALAKMNPKKFGDKVDVTSDGEKITNAIPLVLGDGRSYEDLKNELKPE